MRVVIGGTRYTLTPAHKALISHVLSAVVNSSPIGQPPAFVTGCCKTGVDLYVRQWAYAHCWPMPIIPASQATTQPYKPGTLTVITAQGRTAPALTMRTVTMTSLAQNQVISFPLSAAYQKSGSWLLAHTAALMGKSLTVIMPPQWQGQLPTCHNISTWRSEQASFRFNGATGFSVHVPVIAQTSLFQ